MNKLKLNLKTMEALFMHKLFDFILASIFDLHFPEAANLRFRRSNRGGTQFNNSRLASPRTINS